MDRIWYILEDVLLDLFIHGYVENMMTD